MRRNFGWLVRSLMLLPALTACENQPNEPEPPIALERILRIWKVSEIRLNASRVVEIARGDSEQLGVIDTTLMLGEVDVTPEGPGRDAEAEVFSNETGGTYWVSSESPNWPATPDSTAGSASELRQFQMFRKTAEQASLQYVISDVFLEAIDDNGQSPETDGCRWFTGGRSTVEECEKLMSGTVSFTLDAGTVDTTTLNDPAIFAPIFFTRGGAARFFGYRGAWLGRAHTLDESPGLFWTRMSFQRINDAQDSDRGGQFRLAAPITIDVPIDSLPVGSVFLVAAIVESRAYSRRRRESYMSAYFSDPLKTGGGSFTYRGLESLPVPQPLPTFVAAEPSCSGGPGAGGTMQFDSTAYFEPEQAGGRAWVVVTRVGATDDVASARVTTAPGSALPGSDYEAVDTYVVFADGASGSRLVEIPIVADDVAEPNETLDLILSEVAGCGSLGAPSFATLTIEDDDRPPLEIPTYTVGGTVTGLSGTGLVLTNVSTDDLAISTDGPFVFGPEYPDGFNYIVRVDTQPTNPIQVCTVADGSGVIAGADVTDIVVDCVTPPPSDNPLDPGFGAGGKVTQGSIPGASDIAVQSDGKIVAVGGNVVARYNPDGSLDGGFGSGGEVTVVFNNTSDVLNGVAVQSDGRIVVVGYATDPAGNNGEDWAVARLNADGTLDASFGAGGTVMTDFAGVTDRAWDVAIQDDGGIVVAGHAATSTLLGPDNDYAVARYTAAGVLDNTFGLGGSILTTIGGMTDLGYAITLQADGKIAVTGRVADDGGDDPDVGVVRYNADGSLDAGFGTGGILRVQVPNTADVWEEGRAIAVQPDGKIVVVGFSFANGKSQFLVARFEAEGSLDVAFGTAGTGVELVAFSAAGDFGYGVALQADGKIVAVGQASNESNPDFAIARLTADGTLDQDFSEDGTFVVDFFGAGDVANAVALQSDGKIVVAGLALNGVQPGLGLLRALP